MSHEPRATSHQEIAGWIREAATTEPWRPGHQTKTEPVAMLEMDDFHSVRIATALSRASRKTFVKMLKPFRRIFRNQGAVNDSLIEAATHLAAQNEGMIGQLAELHDRVSGLQAQVRTLLQREGSTGSNSQTGLAAEPESSTVPKTSAPAP